MVQEKNTCSVCGGDKQYRNAFGSVTSCPGCRGTGVAHTQIGLGSVDVTKTKTKRSNVIQPKPARPTRPFSIKGINLETLINSSNLSADARKKLLDQIIDFEIEKGSLTETARKKIWKQLPK